MNLNKKLFIAMAAALSFQLASAQSGVPAGMEITAQEWCKSVKAGWNLGNSFECAGGGGENWNRETWWFNSTWNNDVSTWDTAWGNPATTKLMIDAVKAAGFNAVRIPVRWFPHITKEDDNVIEIDAQWLNRVKQVVDWCLANDMYVLLNTHHEHWLEYDAYTTKAPKINTRLRKLWTCLANEFKSYDGRLAFAGVNEVTDNWKSPTDENKQVLNGFHKTFVDAVRATGGNNLYRNLVVQTYACDPGYGFNDLVIPQDVVDNRMSVEFHYYQPWDYCGSPTTYKWTNVAGMESVMNRAKTTWMDKGYGVIIGEYGCVMHYDEDASAEVKEIQKLNTAFYNQTICQIMRANGFAGFVWDSSNFGNGEEKFGIFNRQAGMRVDNKYALAGIVEGAGITNCNVSGLPSVPDDASYFDDPNNVDPTPGGGDNPGSNDKPEIPAMPDPEQPGTDPTTTSADWYTNLVNGKYTWTGNKEIQWSSGLYISKDNFSPLPANTDDNQLVVFYEITNQNESMLKFCYDDSGWKEIKVTSRGVTSEIFQCKDVSSAQDGRNMLIVNLPASTLTNAYFKGHDMVIQGTGAAITGYIVVNANTVNQLAKGDANADHKVDIADVVSVITYLQKVKAGKDVDWIVNRKSANVNTIAGVDNDDVKGIAEIILAQ